GFGKHLKQTGNYGLHRGYFAKVFPETSMKLASLYFVPSLFVVFLVLGAALSPFHETISLLYFLGLGVYLIAVIVSSLMLVEKTKSLAISVMTIPYMISFHIWYGIRFVQGYFFIKELKSKLGK
ncbi:hypothetical protein ACFL16_03040, partial [Patescibacteria group bacterium]